MYQKTSYFVFKTRNFADAEFSPESGCLLSGTDILTDKVEEHVADEWKKVQWERLQVVPGSTAAGAAGLDARYSTGSGPPEPLYATDTDNGWRNIIGGFLGDCALTSCLTVLAEDMRLIRRMIVDTDRFARTGAFVTRFSKRGSAVEVVTDGAMPMLQYGEGRGPMPAFCHASDCLWPSLLQKAYAKLRGSYQTAMGDTPSFIMQALTGAPSAVHLLTEDEDAREGIWEELQHATEKGYVVCACAEEQTGVNMRDKGGEFHAYAILQVMDIADLDEQLVQIRNPLGHAWQNMDAQVAPAVLQDNPHKRKEDAPRWPPEMCQRLGVESPLEPARNGVFWVNLKDMHHFFHSIVVNKASGERRFHSAESRLDCSTSVGGGTAFFSMQLEHATGDAVVTVTQQGLNPGLNPGADIPPLSFSVWSLTNGKQVGHVEPTAAEVVTLECSFSRDGDYYIIVDSVCNEDVSRQVVLGVTCDSNPLLSGLPDHEPLDGGMLKLIAMNGQRGAEGFHDPDSYHRHGVADVSMTSWGMWSPAHLRYWRFFMHDNAGDATSFSEVLQFELENMQLFREGEQWISIALEPNQKQMVVLQSVGQASLRLAYALTSRKLQLLGAEAVEERHIQQAGVPQSAPAPAPPPVAMAPPDIAVDAPAPALAPTPAPTPAPAPAPAPAPVQPPVVDTTPVVPVPVVVVEDSPQIAAAPAPPDRETQYHQLQREAAERLEAHQRAEEDHQIMLDAQAEQAGIALELERRGLERNKLEEAAMGHMVIPSVPIGSAPASAPARSASADIAYDNSKIKDTEQVRTSRDRAEFTSKADRDQRSADKASEKARADKRAARNDRKRQDEADRTQRRVHEAQVAKAQARMKKDGAVDSWDRTNELAKREAERMLKREHERKQKTRREREARTNGRRQKQIQVLKMKADTNLNHWKEMHSRVEVDNTARAKAAAARYTAEQKKKIQRDEFERKKKEMLESQKKQSQQTQREKFDAAEARRKEAEAAKEAEVIGARRAQDRAKTAAGKQKERAAAMGNIQERLRTVFNKADDDGDGNLTVAEVLRNLKGDKEFKSLLAEAGMKPDSTFQQLDGDGDGQISFLEFLKILDVHRQKVEKDADTKKGLAGAVASIVGGGDVAVLSNNTMELRMRVLLEEQSRKEASERETRAADIARQITQEDANQRMRQSMRDFEESRQHEADKIAYNVEERRRVLADKQRVYQQRLREMKKKQTSRTEPFFLSSTDKLAPKAAAHSNRYVCVYNTPIRASMLPEPSLRKELQEMEFTLLKKRAAASGIQVDGLSPEEMVDGLMERNNVGTLKHGEEVVGLEERIDENQVVRVRTARGWVARDSRDGQNLQPRQAWKPNGENLVPKQAGQDKAPAVRRSGARRSRTTGFSDVEGSSEVRQDAFAEADPTATNYHVEFETGDMGDVIGDLYLRLQGTLGSSKTVLCSNVSWQHFERGSRCSFVFQAPWLGQVKSVAVGHNVGEELHEAGARMLLSNVVVRHMDTGTAWRFPCQQWLDDVSRMCIIPEAGSALADGGHNAVRSISYSGARVAFTLEQEQKLHRITVSLRAIAPETTSVPVTVDLVGIQDGQEYTKSVQLSLQVPDTSFTTTVETVGKFSCAAFGPLQSCTIRDLSGACSGLGSRVHIYVDHVMVEVKGTEASWFFDCHRWLDNKDGVIVAPGPTPRGLHPSMVVHPPKRGLVEQIRDAAAEAAQLQAGPMVAKTGREPDGHRDLPHGPGRGVTWHDVAEWEGEGAPPHPRSEGWTDTQLKGISPAGMVAASAAADAGQVPASEHELLIHHRNYQDSEHLQEEDMVYVVRIQTGDAEAIKSLRQNFRQVPPTVTLTVFGTHGAPMMINVPVAFIPYAEERFIVRVQQYHGVLQGMRVSIDDTAPGAPALPFNWNLLCITVTDMRRMQTWHSVCRSTFTCSNSITAALLRPTATGRAAAHTITLILGPGTAGLAKKSRLQVFISSIGGEGAIALIAVPWAHDDPKLSTRAVLRCPEAWLPHLGDQLELGLCAVDDAGVGSTVHVSQAIVMRDGVPMRYRFEREITAGAVHYGTPMEVPQGADLLRLDDGNTPAASIAVDPTPMADFTLRLHFTDTALYNWIECCIGFWQVEPSSSKFAVAWTPVLQVTKDAAYYAARESYENKLTLRSPGAELWGIKIKAQGSSWGIGFVELVNAASNEVYSCNCDGSPLVREELPDGTKIISRELVFATKQPLEQVSRDPTISPWEEWKQDQLCRADEKAEKERRAAGLQGAMDIGLRLAQKAMRNSNTVTEKHVKAEELRQRKEAAAQELREMQRQAQQIRERQLKEAAEAARLERQREEAARLQEEQEAWAARQRVQSEETQEAGKAKSLIEQVMEGTQMEYQESQCHDALQMAEQNVPDAIMRLMTGKHGGPR